ncbi:response regulator [Desertivirga brevis]|uniref:response regulator n=1 Tax=Desertivirga brevis TaxID=2810310 RepID=UPI001A97B856|nr:response regulator [Pedobacter sp. SYSU D00873]
MKKRIFIIEKDDDILQVIEHLFREEGYEVFTANSEFGIFEKIRNSRPHAILLDVISTTPQGTELCRALKSEEGIRHIPVIVLSTHLKVEMMKGDCADDVLSKPFDIAMLVEIVEGQLMDFAR